MDFLDFQIREIEALKLREGEDVILEKKDQRLETKREMAALDSASQPMFAGFRHLHSGSTQTDPETNPRITPLLQPQKNKSHRLFYFWRMQPLNFSSRSRGNRKKKNPWKSWKSD